MKTKKVILKGINWALAGIVTLLGFAGCGQEYEYGTPYANYVVKGTVVDKATGKPVKGIQIQVGYRRNYDGPTLMYGSIPVRYEPKTRVTTDAQGEFKIISNSYDEPLAISVEDIDGVENGVFQPEIMWLDVNEAEQTKKPSGAWYEGAYTFTVNVELTEAETEIQ